MARLITLYHCDGARSFRPLWMLGRNWGLAYELKMLPFPPRVFAKDYLALNPLGTIPLMIDGDTRMTESSGICHYLRHQTWADAADVSPDEGAYGAFLNWMYFSDATLTFPQTLVLRYSQLDRKSGAIRRSQPTMRNGFSAGFGPSRPRPANAETLCAGRLSPGPTSSSATRCGSPTRSGSPRISARTPQPIGPGCNSERGISGRWRPNAGRARSRMSRRVCGLEVVRLVIPGRCKASNPEPSSFRVWCWRTIPE